MKNLLLPLFALVAVGLLAGCATPVSFVKAYPGAERPADQVATITVPASVEVRSINGAPQPNITGTLLKATYTITTLPGAQTWTVRYNAPLAGGYYDQRDVVTETAWLPFEFTAEAGGAYRLSVDVPRHSASTRDAEKKIRFGIAKEGQAPAVTGAAPAPAPVAGAAPAPVARAPAPALAPVALALAPAPVAPAPPPPPLQISQPAAPQTLETAAFEQLKKWWTAAGPSERQSFRDWLKTQP